MPIRLIYFTSYCDHATFTQTLEVRKFKYLFTQQVLQLGHIKPQVIFSFGVSQKKHRQIKP